MTGEELLAHLVRAAQEADVGDEYTAGDRGHAPHHDAEQFGTRHAFQVRLDHERRLRLADKYIGGGGQALRPAQAHRLTQQPRKTVHDLLQNTQIVEDGRKGRKKYDGRQHLKGEDVPEAVQVGHDAPEQKLRSRAGELQRLPEPRRDVVEHGADSVHLQDQYGQYELHAYADPDQPPVDRAPVGAEEVTNTQHDAHPERGAKKVVGKSHVSG